VFKTPGEKGGAVLMLPRGIEDETWHDRRPSRNAQYTARDFELLQLAERLWRRRDEIIEEGMRKGRLDQALIDQYAEVAERLEWIVGIGRGKYE
jgi:hypothetical protein